MSCIPYEECLKVTSISKGYVVTTDTAYFTGSLMSLVVTAIYWNSESTWCWVKDRVTKLSGSYSPALAVQSATADVLLKCSVLCLVMLICLS